MKLSLLSLHLENARKVHGSAAENQKSLARISEHIIAWGDGRKSPGTPEATSGN